jgi:hypothetical protein
MRNHVFIATPCFGGMVTQHYMESVINLMAAAPDVDVELTLAMLGQDALITRSRNALVAQFLSRPSATHLLFVDADIGFQPEHVWRLLAARKPVIAGMYPLKANYWTEDALRRTRDGEHPYTAALHYVGELKKDGAGARRGETVRATYVGTGFMLIEREAILKLCTAYPNLQYKYVHAAAPSARTEHYALFDCLIDEGGFYLSEDYAFCKRWAEIGGEIWLDLALDLTHSGMSTFHGQPSVRHPATPIACTTP